MVERFVMKRGKERRENTNRVPVSFTHTHTYLGIFVFDKLPPRVTAKLLQGLYMQHCRLILRVIFLTIFRVILLAAVVVVPSFRSSDGPCGRQMPCHVSWAQSETGGSVGDK